MGGGGCTSEPVSPFGRGRGGVGGRGERGGAPAQGGTGTSAHGDIRPRGHGGTGAQGQAPTGTSAHGDTGAQGQAPTGTRGRPPTGGSHGEGRPVSGGLGTDPEDEAGSRDPEPRPGTGPGAETRTGPGEEPRDRTGSRGPGPTREPRPRTDPRNKTTDRRESRDMDGNQARPTTEREARPGRADRAGAHHYPVGPTTGSASPGAAAPAAPCRISLRTSSTRSTGSKGFARKASTPNAFPLSISYCVHALMIATGT